MRWCCASNTASLWLPVHWNKHKKQHSDLNHLRLFRLTPPQSHQVLKLLWAWWYVISFCAALVLCVYSCRLQTTQVAKPPYQLSNTPLWPNCVYPRSLGSSEIYICLNPEIGIKRAKKMNEWMNDNLHTLNLPFNLNDTRLFLFFLFLFPYYAFFTWRRLLKKQRKAKQSKTKVLAPTGLVKTKTACLSFLSFFSSSKQFRCQKLIINHSFIHSLKSLF